MAAGPTLSERILVHLSAYPVDRDAMDVPREVTQEGIADALAARVAHVSRALKQLIAQGLVAAHIARPRGGKRRSRAHALTDAGRKARVPLPASLPKPASSASPLSAPAPRSAPAGRTREWTILRDLVARAATDGPRIALIEGDAGSGKSRLLDSLAAAAAPARVLRGASVPVGGEQILGPLRAALEPLGFDARYRAHAAGTPRERAMPAAVESITQAARAQPLIVVLDDLQAAGPTMAEFLHGLLQALPKGTRVLFLAAFRREEEWELPNGPLYTALMPLRDAPHATHLLLPALDRDGVAQLLADAGTHVKGDTNLPAELVDRVWRESGGNAAFALAMGEQLADGVDEEDFFPATVRSAATRQFSTLDSAQLSLLQLSAVAGAEFRYDVLARAFEGKEEELVPTLDFLIDRLFLEESPHAADGELLIRFQHPKVREAVLAGLTATRRRWLEQRVASGLSSK